MSDDQRIPLDEDDKLPDGATVIRDGNRVTLSVELPADVVPDDVTEYAIRLHLADAAS